jgi:tetratricopeptide (TPR) repeat protein
MTTLELEARAQAALGRTAAVDQLLEEAVAMSPEAGGAADGVFVNAARELRAHGHHGAARAVLARLIRRLRNVPREDLSFAARRTLAGALYFAGDWDESARMFEPLLASDPDNVHLLGFVSVLAARRGDAQAALAGIERLDTLPQPYLRGANTYWQAEVAAVLGDRSRAVQLLHRAYREGQPVPVKAHSDPELESLRGDPEYRRLVAMRR